MGEDISPSINNIVCDILNVVTPSKLILYHQKIGSSGKVLGCKFCIVMDTKDRLEIEKKIYKTVDSDVPFDIIIYTIDEWEQISHKKDSFASHIIKKGVVLYGKV